jgi:tetraacyldisaccharide 4'-kinase
LSHRTYLQIVSGEAPGWIGGPARLALTVLSWPYSAVVRVRNHLYTSGRLTVHRAGVPVICVGNLTTGGTGKTPLVVWLCRRLREKQVRCAVLTRGYKMQGGELSDEPALLAAQCADVAVVVNPDRVAGAAEAIRRHDAQVLVMDDGFQHRRLARDLDIVAIDATRPFGYRSMDSGITGKMPVRRSMGVPPMKAEPRWPCDAWARCPCYGRVLPAGLLREPITGLRRAHAVVLTRCDQVAQDALQQIEEIIRRANPDLVIARSIHAPVAIKTGAGTEIGIDQLRGQRVFAFCGIGNPESFSRTIERLGAVRVGSRVYDDHYRYAVGDIEQIRRESAEREASLILTTQKDWTKIAPFTTPQEHPPLACLAVELQITAGKQKLTALLDRLLHDTMPNR